MKIYTKQGDGGLTSLIGGERVFKTDARVEAYGTVDELTAFVAMLADLLHKEEGMESYVKELRTMLAEAMTVEALLAVGEGGEGKVQPLAETCITRLEEAIDRMQSEGIVSPPDGSKPRAILITAEEFMDRFMMNEGEEGK
jgi:cob(I)alamin adenosyltransferase